MQARQPEIYARWASETRRARLFRPGERVGVAVSGGPDSILLLDFMKQFAADEGLRLTVVHFNHRLRGAESNADESFVRRTAGDLGIEFICDEADVARVARERRQNLEATARDLRYRFFLSLVRHGRLDKVTTGHTADDQAETVLLRLLRGSGTRGLAGIYPVLGGKIVRPFLNLTRDEVEKELQKRRLQFRRDPTNLDPKFTRNKVRMELLPLLKRNYNPGIVLSLKHLADRARDDESYLEQVASERARAWRVRQGRDERIPVRALAEFPLAIERRVLRQMIAAARGNLQGVTHGHIESLRRLATEAQSGRSLALPGGILARKEFDWVVVSPRVEGRAGKYFSYPVELPGRVAVPELALAFRFDISEIADTVRRGKAYNHVGEGCLDPDKLGGELVLRNWHPGDRFWPSGSRRGLKVKQLFQKRKIPSEQRKQWPLLTSGSEIVWVRGFPPAGRASASSASRRVLLIREEHLEI